MKTTKLIPLFALTIACQDFETPDSVDSIEGQTLSEVLAGPTLDAMTTSKETLQWLSTQVDMPLDDHALALHESGLQEEQLSGTLSELNLPSDMIIDADLASWLDLAGMPVDHAMDESIANMLEALDQQSAAPCNTTGITLGIVFDDKIIANQHEPQPHIQVGEVVPERLSMENPYTNTDITASTVDEDANITWYEGVSTSDLGEQTWIGAQIANSFGQDLIVGVHLNCQ